MRRKVLVGIIAVVALTVCALADTARPPRRHLPRQPTTTQFPTIGPELVSDGTPESDRALEQIQEALKEHGCQLGVEVRIGGDGNLEPRIRVEWVQWCIVTPPKP